ncbi:MAG: ABC transporter substrate-binding protein [Candidatus Sumerlaeia bacterium]|nr:ABC transporter substrate-binding protein [Candidatus Sumerlaeia bacterium]
MSPETPVRTLTLGHSPDPDDAFMFYALAADRIETGELRFEHILQDIQTLNERALREELDISAISVHAYASVLDKYALLPCGASMGDNYGPMIVAREPFAPEALKSKRIAVPGRLTSAFLALKLYMRGDFDHIVVPFDEIMDAVKAGRADAGLLIHEGQLTYEAEGLACIVNLGEWWFEHTNGLPLPLGANVIRKALGKPMISRLNRILAESIRYGLEHRQEAVRHSLQWGRGMSHEMADTFVGMYVNELTLDFGERGRAGVERFLHEAHAMGFIPAPVALEFAE